MGEIRSPLTRLPPSAGRSTHATLSMSLDTHAAPVGPWLHRFAVLTALCTWVLIWVGGLVTSTDSGLAVPDWPLSYGMLMPPMVGGIFYEHGHRMVATFVGFLTTVLALWLWRREPRLWLKRLGAAALVMVIAQGVLGGITVIYLLPTAVSVSHATLAQTFFCVTVLIALATSTEWKRAAPRPVPRHASLGRLALGATCAVYLQLVLGAVVRHTGSGLAIRDFPLALGRIVPPLGDPAVTLHFAHRVGAVIVAGIVGWLVLRMVRWYWHVPCFRRMALSLSVLVLAQILLGGALVWTARAVLPTTAHVATGALLLAVCWLVTLRAFLHLGASETILAESRRPQPTSVLEKAIS